MKLIWFVLGSVLVLLIVFGVYKLFQRAALSQEMVPELGVQKGQLRACPNSPNCVSSFSRTERHAIETLPGGLSEFNALATWIAESGEADIKVLAEGYLWATYQSSFFGFVDDLELYYDGAGVQVRSASREGYSDLGANRARVETLRSYIIENL